MVLVVYLVLVAVFEACSAPSVQLAIDLHTFTPKRDGEESGGMERYRVLGLEIREYTITL